MKINILDEKKKNKLFGIFYTPTYIIRFILEKIISQCINEGKDPASLTILDPSCGNGLFLLNYVNYLSSGGFNHDKNLLIKNIYGVDINGDAIKECRNAFYSSHSLIIENNIKCGNSIIDNSIIDPHFAFNWEKEFPEIMNTGGFDIIVGNPPWVSLKGKQSNKKTDETTIDYFLQRYPSNRYRPNLFEIFIWKSIELLKDGGYLGFLLPDRICTNDQFSGLRKYLSEKVCLKYLWFHPVFENVISDNVVLILKKSIPEIDSKVSIAEFPLKEFIKISQSEYTSKPGFKWIYSNPEDETILQMIRSNPACTDLCKDFSSAVGFIGKAGSISNENRSPSQLRIIKGRHIERFCIINNYFFDFTRENIIGGSSDLKKLSEKNKVFLRKTGNKLIAVFDNKGFIPEQSLYFISSRNGNSDDLIILSAILNSELMNYYYLNFAITNRDSTPQLKKIDLDKFPVIIPEGKDIILDTINQLCTIIKSDNTNKQGIDLLLQKINNLIYSAYKLTDKEILLIKTKLQSSKPE